MTNRALTLLTGAALVAALGAAPACAVAADRPHAADTVAAQAAGRHTVTAQTVAVPAYWGPGSTWTTTVRGAPTAGVMIANVDSGPGAGGAQADWASAIKAAHRAGIKVYGYVDTGYFGTTGRLTRGGQTSTAAWTSQAESDVNAWYADYGADGISGIFFDDALADCGTNNVHVDLYTAIEQYVKGHEGTGATVVDNPGTGAAQCYLRAADTLVTFEDTYAAYTSWTPPAWEASAAPGQVWNIVYDTPTRADMANAITLSKQRDAGYVYVTDGNGGNPYASLPTYWSGELAAAAG